MRTRSLATLGILVTAAALVGAIFGPWSAAWAPRAVIVGSTTTTQDTGLLDVLQDAYRAQTGVPLRIVVAGTGAILQQGRNGDLDVLLTHDREREISFVAGGDGLWRRPVMYNWFVLVGPIVPSWQSPWTREQLATNATAFLTLLYEHRGEITFVSRGDGSGTYSRELALWAAAGIPPANLTGNWYKETGTGQAETLRVAVQFGAYALCDEATWNRHAAAGLTGNLTVVVRDFARMRNQYGVTPISDARHPQANAEGGIAFALWLTGPAGQAVIRNYTVGGLPAFYPDADDSTA